MNRPPPSLLLPLHHRLEGGAAADEHRVLAVRVDVLEVVVEEPHLLPRGPLDRELQQVGLERRAGCRALLRRLAQWAVRRL